MEWQLKVQIFHYYSRVPPAPSVPSQRGRINKRQLLDVYITDTCITCKPECASYAQMRSKDYGCQFARRRHWHCAVVDISSWRKLSTTTGSSVHKANGVTSIWNIDLNMVDFPSPPILWHFCTKSHLPVSSAGVIRCLVEFLTRE